MSNKNITNSTMDNYYAKSINYEPFKNINENFSNKPQTISSQPTLNRYLNTNTNLPDIQNKTTSQEPTILENNNKSIKCPECIQKPCECVPVICKECPKCTDCNISIKKEIQNCKNQYEGTITNLYNFIYILLLFVIILGYMVFT